MARRVTDEERPITIVLRQYPDGQAIALMPDEIDPRDGTVMSYMHLGQHGAADYPHVIATTRVADPFSDEVKALKKELDAIGYKAKYRQRRDRRNRR